MEWIAGIPEEDLKVFLQEAEEQLQRLDEDLVKLERERSGPELLQEIFRAAHTLKGSSGMLGHRRMAELSHAMESILDRVRKGTLAVSPPIIDALLRGVDGLRLLKDELATRRDSGVDVPSLVADLERKGSEKAVQTEAAEDGVKQNNLVLAPAARERLRALLATGHRAYTVKVTLSQETEWAAVRCFQVLTLLSEAGDVIGSAPSQDEIEQGNASGYLEVILATTQEAESLRTTVATVDEVAKVDITPYALEATPAQEPSGIDGHSQSKSPDRQTVRIDVERLDHLANTVGELVIDSTRIIQIARALDSRYRGEDMVEAMGKTSVHIMKLADELHESALKMRMLPVGMMFSGFPRTVRDLARNASKNVDFTIDGQETEIDRGAIERLRDPLIHLLRNAVDHGIEPPEERRTAGKPETGRIHLSASHEQGQIVIAIEDDGRGIDHRRVREAAVRKGLITAEAAAGLSEREALDLIFMPGASTAEKVTEISGRGVGMDIVKTNVEAINGFVTIDTKVGQGTKVTLKLPLTLAALRALLVSSSNAIYAIPLVHILEAVKLEPGRVSTVGGKEVMRLRGDVVPLLQLGNVLGLRVNGTSHSKETFAVVVRFGERVVGLLVDSLLDSQEVVVKSLGNYIGRVRGVGGASVLGDGRVVLILDVPNLMNAALARVGKSLAA